MPPSLRSTRRRVAELEAEVARLEAERSTAAAALSAASVGWELVADRVDALEVALVAHAEDERRHLPRVEPRTLPAPTKADLFGDG